MSEENLVDQVQSEVDTPEASNEPTWGWSDELPGDGDKPEWFIDSKYKTVADQAKGYKELQSEFSKKVGAFTGAPEEYEVALPEDLVLPEGVEWALEADDPLIGALAPVMKEMQVSQEGFNQLVKTYIEYEAGKEAAAMAEEEERATRELSSIPEGAKRVSDVSAWAKANLSEGDFEAFKSTLTDSNALQMYENMIKLTRNSKIPDTQGNVTGVTREELDAMYQAKDESGQNKYATDKKYRERVQGLERRYFGS